MKSWLKVIIISIIAIIILIACLMIFLNNRQGSIRIMTCLDSENLSGKHNLKIPCLEDSDCNDTKMKDFCSPAEVGSYKCGFRDFCGDDGYCMHDCSLSSLGK